jgi:hypothetical protein
LRQSLFDRRTALTFIESKCGNINKGRYVWMIAGLGDDGPAVLWPTRTTGPPMVSIAAFVYFWSSA